MRKRIWLMADIGKNLLKYEKLLYVIIMCLDILGKTQSCLFCVKGCVNFVLIGMFVNMTVCPSSALSQASFPFLS
jgi:hypothetical protein